MDAGRQPERSPGAAASRPTLPRLNHWPLILPSLLQGRDSTCSSSQEDPCDTKLPCPDFKTLGAQMAPHLEDSMYPTTISCRTDNSCLQKQTSQRGFIRGYLDEAVLSSPVHCHSSVNLQTVHCKKTTRFTSQIYVAHSLFTWFHRPEICMQYCSRRLQCGGSILVSISESSRKWFNPWSNSGDINTNRFAIHTYVFPTSPNKEPSAILQPLTQLWKVSFTWKVHLTQNGAVKENPVKSGLHHCTNFYHPKL